MSHRSPAAAEPGGPATVLARWAAGVRPDALPAAVRARTTEMLIDAVGCAIAGRNAREVEQISALAQQVGADGAATVIAGGTTAPAAACLVNGYLITALTMTDIHHPTFCHIAPEVVPPALAIAERRGSSGRDLLVALAVGMEVAVRVGLGIDYATARQRGWHMPGVIGPFGGAVAGARLNGLDDERTRAALGLAGSQSAGTFAHWLTPTVKFQQARGALSGLLAAELAATGFRSSAEVFSHPDGGIFHAYSDGGRPDDMLANLDRRWEVMEITLRRWPGAAANQSIIECLLALLEEHTVDTAEVAKVEVRLSETAFGLVGHVGWEDPFRALLSPRYVVAVVLHDRRCWIDQFTTARLADADVVNFAGSQVEVRADAGVAGNGATVRVELSSGEVIEAARETPKGEPARPLERDDVLDKFRDCIPHTADRDAAERLLVMLLTIEDQPSARAVVGAMSAASLGISA